MEQYELVCEVFPDSSESGEASDRRLMADVHWAYRQGLLQPKVPEDSCWEIDEGKNLTTAEWESDRLTVSTCLHHMEAARRSAVRGDVETACELFGLARTFAEKTKLSEEARLLCRSQMNAAEAYLDYACGDFKQAIRRLEVAIVADQQLEDRFGQTRMHGHRLHLVNNMVKVEARAGRLSSAMELAASVFLYLEGERDALPVPAAWGRTYLDRLPLERRQFLSSQLAGELAVFIAGVETKLRDPWQTLVETIQIHKDHQSWRPEVAEWFPLKDLAVRNSNQNRFLQECVSFLQKGPRCATLLWQIIAIDAAFASQALPCSEALNFRRAVLADFQAHKSLPRRVRTMLGKMQTVAPSEAPVFPKGGGAWAGAAKDPKVIG